MPVESQILFVAALAVTSVLALSMLLGAALFSGDQRTARRVLPGSIEQERLIRARQR